MQIEVAGVFFNLVKQKVPQCLSKQGLQSKCHRCTSSCFSNLSGKLPFKKKKKKGMNKRKKKKKHGRTF